MALYKRIAEKRIYNFINIKYIKIYRSFLKLLYTYLRYCVIFYSFIFEELNKYYLFIFICTNMMYLSLSVVISCRLLPLFCAVMVMYKQVLER